MTIGIAVYVSCPLLWAQTSLTLKQRIFSFNATYATLMMASAKVDDVVRNV